jgi:hypothetical protein
LGAGRGEVYVGPIHGDLHAKNVRARSGDAIVIDFLASKSGPIILDAASLEASLLIDGFVDDPRSANDWFKSVECLYSSDPLLRAPTHQHRKDLSNWFHTSVRQIRLYGAQMEVEAKQYAAALAVALLRKVKKDDSLRGIEDERRAIAYLFASRVLSRAFGPQERAAPEPEPKAS